MNHDDAQLFAARCLTEPAFLEKAIAFAKAAQSVPALDPSAYSTPAEAAACFGIKELERLKLFSGFITKVKHGSLRKLLPATLRLLGEFNVELSFFVAFSAHYATARSRGPLSVDGHMSLFERHFFPYLKRLKPDDASFLGDVFVHERTLWEVCRPRTSKERRGSPKAISWNGRCIIRRYSTDVQAACLAAKLLTFDGGRYANVGTYSLAYWCEWESKRVSMFELDEITTIIFSEVDGARTIPMIAASLAKKGAPQITVEKLEEFFVDAASQGLVKCAGTTTT